MAQEFKAIITVFDRATEPLRRINRGVAGLSAPFSGLSKALGGFGRELGLVKVGNAAGAAMGKVQALGGSLGGLAGPLAAMGAAASAGGLLALGNEAADFGEELDKAAIKTGETVDALAKLHHVTEAAHIETAVMDKGLIKLNRTLAEAAGGKNKSAAAMFRALKIDIGGMGKPVKTAAEILPRLSDAFMRNANAAMRTRIANTAFGKAGAELIPILQMGSAELRKQMDEYERYFGKITPQMIRSMRDGDEAFDRMNAASKGLRLSIGAALIPTITRLAVPMTNWIVANRELVSQRVADFVSKFGNALASINWNAVGNTLSGIAKGFAAIGRFLGPVGSTIAVLAIAFGPFIGGAIGAAAAILKLGWSIGVLAFRLAALAFGAVIGAIGNFVTAIRAGYGAMAAFNLVLAANPIGAILIGITALAAAAFLIWKYWKPIKKFFGDLWDGIAHAFTWAWNKIKPIVDAVMKAGQVLWGIMKWTPVGMALQGGMWAGKQMQDAGMFALPERRQYAPLPAMQRFGAPGRPGLPGANGKVEVKVDLTGLPQGSRTSTKASPGINLDVGTRFDAIKTPWSRS